MRPLLLVLVLGTAWGVGKATGITDELSADSVRLLVADTGVWGVLLYLLVFVGGELVHVPGLVFVGAAALAWGGWLGFAAALVGSVVSVCASFVVVRMVGGKALTAVERPFVKRMLSRLESRPIRTIIVLRLLLWLAPPLNYALAMTGVRFRDYAIGSMLGLALPVAGMYVFFDYLL